MEKSKKITLNTDFLDLAYKFWRLSENAIKLMGETGNKDIVITSGDKTFREGWKKAENIIEWNANSIGIPVLFNFYHGLELFMKGFMFNERIIEQKTHILTDLYKELKAQNSAPRKILDVLKEILFSKDNALYRFFSDNDSNVDKFYLLFRYPINNNNKNVDYKLLCRSEMKNYRETFQLVEKYIHELYNLLVDYNCSDQKVVEMIKK